MDELKTRVNKLYISEKLIKGYEKIPPSLKEQAITTLAIQLCQNVNLKKDIIFEEKLQQDEVIPWYKWEMSVKAGSTYVCQKLPLPFILKNLLIVRMRTIALQLYDWSWQQGKFKLSPLSADSFLIPSDWIVVDMRLDEQKIAKRLVQDKRIRLVQRYRMACFHCLENFILSLWNQISIQRRKRFLHHTENTIVHLWSKENSSRNLKKSTRSDGRFCLHLLEIGVFEGSISSVLQSWSKLNTSTRQEVLIDTAVNAVTKVFLSQYRSPSSTDILYFLLTRMSKEQRISFFQIAFQNTEDCILVCFLQWPYMDLLLPIINELWTILPESKYGFLLFDLAHRYSDTYPYTSKRKDYMDYDYGYLIIDLLKESPDHFKRYVFGNTKVANSASNNKLIYTMLRKGVDKIQYREICKFIWQHITLEERRYFIKSYRGKKFCCDFLKQNNCELLTSILKNAYLKMK